jgi:formamidopyrimidine-DNA glycosylase
MPELPEVETVRAILSQILTGKTIAKVTLIRPKNCATDPKVFVHDLVGQTFLKVTRKGKLLALHLTRDLVVVSHLRMEGKYFEAKVGDPLSKFDLVIYDCTDGTSLRYNDVRKFGVFGLYNESNYLSDSGFAALGKEPFDLTPTELYKGFQKMASKSIKEALLDQSLIAGIGNIYDNEILFRLRDQPEDPGQRPRY